LDLSGTEQKNFFVNALQIKASPEL